MPPRKKKETSSDAIEVAKRQYDGVVQHYNDLSDMVQFVKTSTAQFEKLRTKIANEIDATLDTTRIERADMKRENMRYQALSKLIADNWAHGLVLEGLESRFRREWNNVKGESLERRKVFLKEKYDEVERVHNAFVEKLEKQLEEAELGTLEKS
jgi:hypothetical protein